VPTWFDGQRPFSSESRPCCRDTGARRGDDAGVKRLSLAMAFAVTALVLLFWPALSRLKSSRSVDHDAAVKAVVRRHYRYQIQGPNAAQILAKLSRDARESYHTGWRNRQE
jgi:glycine cleavage system aminomethyltransferase T